MIREMLIGMGVTFKKMFEKPVTIQYPEQKPVIRASFELASRKLPLGEPLDWMSNAWPREWRLNGKRETFDW